MKQLNEGYIKAKNVSVFYDDFCVLKNVCFECDDGEFVAIVGKSGTGKSSFLNALAGFIPHDGKIEMPESVGYVFQNYALFPWMTVEKNIEFGLSNASRAIKRKRVDEMLNKIDMLDFAKRYPSQLSGGQVQRVALARALAPDPEVLFMDEPYGALDHHTRDRMQQWLLLVWEASQKTVLFVTHYIEEALFLADRIIVVNNNKFVNDIKVPFSRPRSVDIRFQKTFLDMKHKVLEYIENGKNV